VCVTNKDMDLRKKMPELYKSYSEGERLEEAPEAPLPSFARTPEDVEQAENSQANESFGEMLRRTADENVNSFLKARMQKDQPGISDEEVMNQIATIDKMASAGQVAGSLGSVAKAVPKTIMANIAEEGVAQANSMAPERFGKIINVFKDRAPMAPGKIIPVGKVLRAKK
jgi:hypothetical protein